MTLKTRNRREMHCFINKMADINSIGARKLSVLVGIKPEIARNVANFRKQQNGLNRFEELYAVDGVTREIVKRMKSKCTIGKHVHTKLGTTPKRSTASRKLSNSTERNRKISTLQQTLDIPSLRASSPLFSAHGKDTGVKLFFPVSVQSSPSGQKLTTVYQCVSETSKFSGKDHESIAHMSTRAQPPSLKSSPTKRDSLETSERLYTAKKPRSPVAKRKKALSPNKEESIRHWLSSVSVGLTQPSPSAAGNTSRSRSKTPSRNRTSNRKVNTRQSDQRNKTNLRKLSKRSDSMRLKTQRHSERNQMSAEKSDKNIFTGRKSGQRPVRTSTIHTPYHRRSPSKDTISTEALQNNPITLDDLGNAPSGHRREVNEPNVREHGRQMVQRRCRNRDRNHHDLHKVSTYGCRYVDNHKTGSPKYRTESPDRHSMHRSFVRQSYSPVDEDCPDRPRSSSAKRSLWQDREEWQVSRRRRSHSPHDRRRSHEHHPRNLDANICLIL